MLEKLNSRLMSSETRETRAQFQARSYNNLEGEEDGIINTAGSGISCDKCKNKGQIAYADTENGRDEFRMRECECMSRRRAFHNMRKSGLGGLLGMYTFGNYETRNTWQENIKNIALGYVDDVDDDVDVDDAGDFAGSGGRSGATVPTALSSDSALKWLCVFGAVGSGKTHICTAVCNKILENGGKVVYMLWREASVQLKASINNAEEYKRLFAPFKEADVLYIDDFLKGKQGQNPTDADITLAFELINHRYYMPHSRTIISSERSFEDIMRLDAAVGSRIIQRCGEKYRVQIAHGDDKNQRLRV